MDILIVTFRLVGLDDATYRAHAEALAPRFLGVPGLLAKTWLADPATNTYGGVYAFADRASLEAYLASDIVSGMLANPHFEAIELRAFGTVEAATRITNAAAQTNPPSPQTWSDGPHLLSATAVGRR
jgi:hypothetical protein